MPIARSLFLRRAVGAIPSRDEVALAPRFQGKALGICRRIHSRFGLVVTLGARQTTSFKMEIANAVEQP